MYSTGISFGTFSSPITVTETPDRKRTQRKAQFTMASALLSLAVGLHLPRKYSKINSGMLKIRNRITKVATSIRRIIVENLSAFSKLMV